MPKNNPYGVSVYINTCRHTRSISCMMMTLSDGARQPFGSIGFKTAIPVITQWCHSYCYFQIAKPLSQKNRHTTTCVCLPVMLWDSALASRSMSSSTNHFSYLKARFFLKQNRSFNFILVQLWCNLFMTSIISLSLSYKSLISLVYYNCDACLENILNHI